MLLLCGEAGIGKSRLIQDFRDGLGAADYEHLYLQCLPSRTNSAFFPVVRYFRQAAGIRDEEPGQAKLDKLERLLAEGDDRSAVATPIFASLLSLPGIERYGEQQRSPQQLRSQAIEKFVGYVVAKSAARPVLCVVEDVHWMDPSMGELVGELIAQVVNRPVCVVITFRPEFSPPWPDYAHVSSMNLNRLHREQAARIVESVGGEALMAALVDQIVHRSDGVPLYIEELTKSVLERVSVRRDEAVDHLIPATLHSSLVARIDRLGGAKETAQIGAVIGRDFSFDMLAGILDKAEPAITADLDRLVESGLIIRRGGGPDALYSFKHSLVHDATYSTILRSRRRAVHARIIETLERQLADNVLERVDTLAHHAFLGEQWEKAFDYLAHSGARAMRRSALQEAAAQFEHALQSALHLKSTPAIQARVIEVKFELRNALWALGRFEDILTHLDEAER